MVIAKVAVRNNGSSGDTVVSHGDSLAAESVMLSRAVLVKDLGGHGDEGGIGVDILEVGADAARTRLTERVVTLLSVSELEDRTVLVVSSNLFALLHLRGSGRGGGGQNGGDESGREMHIEEERKERVTIRQLKGNADDSLNSRTFREYLYSFYTCSSFIYGYL